MVQTEETFLIRVMKMGYWVDFGIFPLSALMLFIIGIVFFKTNWGEALILAVGGFLLWGFIEYFTHRFLFHRAPLFATGHREHHKRPKLHIGTPFFVTLPAYLLLSWPIALWLGYGITAILLSGFIIGYTGYLVCHHVVHNSKIVPGTFWYRFKKFHDLHHYQQNVNFGVSWRLWDKVFGTYEKQPTIKA